jgi:FtsZ-binding cell division protein ZapB
MEGKLDALGDKIDAVKGKIQELKDELVSLDNYLTDSQPFYNSMNNLNNSVSSLQNKGFMGQIQSLSGNLNSFDVNSPSSAGMPTNLNINVTFPGIGTFNVLDLSQFAMLISFIRKLMTAMLWIGLLLYFIQYVMPRFKV